MLTIYKFPIEITDNQTLEIKGCKGLISVIEQNKKLVIYSFVNTENKCIKLIDIMIAGTGNPISGKLQCNSNFLGTVSTATGLVWHVFYSNHIES